MQFYVGVLIFYSKHLFVCDYLLRRLLEWSYFGHKMIQNPRCPWYSFCYRYLELKFLMNLVYVQHFNLILGALLPLFFIPFWWWIFFSLFLHLLTNICFQIYVSFEIHVSSIWFNLAGFVGLKIVPMTWLIHWHLIAFASPAVMIVYGFSSSLFGRAQ